MSQQYPDHPWAIRKNGRECAWARTRREADRIIQQLSKISPTAQFAVQYQGKSIPHCTDGGKAL